MLLVAERLTDGEIITISILCFDVESASRPLVDFGVLNDNLIK
jgi:hypothetical protein